MQIIFQIILAFGVGIVIGYDRERSGKAAGIRTQMLVCVGSALLAAISIHLGEKTGSNGDPARLMAQIVSGIGFLGAGVILKNGGGKVVGVTTAATIWTTAAIGIAIGSSFYIPAILATLMVLLLDPIAHFQYRYGLKSDYYLLIVQTKKRARTEKAVKFLRLSERERHSEGLKTYFKILSSSQRNEKLCEILDQNKIHYQLELIED